MIKSYILRTTMNIHKYNIIFLMAHSVCGFLEDLTMKTFFSLYYIIDLACRKYIHKLLVIGSLYIFISISYWSRFKIFCLHSASVKGFILFKVLISSCIARCLRNISEYIGKNFEASTGVSPAFLLYTAPTQPENVPVLYVFAYFEH